MGMGILGCGVTLSLRCLIFSCFLFCLFSSVLDSNVDPEIALVHLGHGVVRGGVFFFVCRLVCVSLFGFVSMNALLILSADNSFDQFYSHFTFLLFSYCFFLY